MAFYTGFADPAADGTWGIVFPDLPGCYAAGVDTDDLFAKSIEAMRAWTETMRAEGHVVRAPRKLPALLEDPEVKDHLAAVGPVWTTLQVPMLVDGGRPTKANLSLDASLLEAVDAAAARRGMTRSGFFVAAAQEKIAREG